MFVGFVVGALAVIGVEVVGVLFFIQKLGRKTKEDAVKVAKSRSYEREEPPFSFPDKQVSFPPFFILLFAIGCYSCLVLTCL